MKRSILNVIPALSISLMLLLSVSVFAQVQQEHHRSSAPSVKVEEVASTEIQLLLPVSKPGVVYQGKEVRVFDRLNYNMLLDILVIEDENNEMFAMADPHLIDSIRLEGKLFHYFPEQGFFEYLPGKGRQDVYVKHFVDVNAESVAQGAFGTTNRTTSIDVVRSLVDPSGSDIAQRTIQIESPAGQEIQIYLKRDKEYYLLNDREVHPVRSQRSATRAFPEHSRELRRFLRTNVIDYRKEEDIIRLSEYIYSLGVQGN